jgi:hypothetical protein
MFGFEPRTLQLSSRLAGALFTRATAVTGATRDPQVKMAFIGVRPL